MRQDKSVIGRGKGALLTALQKALLVDLMGRSDRFAASLS